MFDTQFYHKYQLGNCASEVRIMLEEDSDIDDWFGAFFKFMKSCSWQDEQIEKKILEYANDLRDGCSIEDLIWC